MKRYANIRLLAAVALLVATAGCKDDEGPALKQPALLSIQDAAADANVPADQRAADWAARVEEEKALIDAKIHEGGDPFDVLFGADGRSVSAEADSGPVSP